MAEIEKFRGAIIGASCGDALGYPLQNLSVARIKHRFGPFGLRTLVGDPKNGKKAPVSDNTQTLLATIDGILWADAKKLDIIEGIYRSYMRWYYSQTGEEPRRGQKTWMRRQSHEREFCLVREKFMHARRNPEEGLLGAFSKDGRGSTKNKVNDSKGSASLARAVPIGLTFAGDGKMAFDTAVKAAALSHSNPIAILFFRRSCMHHRMPGRRHVIPEIFGLCGIHPDEDAQDRSDPVPHVGSPPAGDNRPAGKTGVWDHIDSIASFGDGTNAEEALAIAIYCSIAVDDPLEAVIISANHGGKEQYDSCHHWRYRRRTLRRYLHPGLLDRRP